MLEDNTTIWKDNSTRQLAEAIFAIDDIVTLQNFLRDVMTKKEIIEISARLQAACMLESGRTYSDIIEKTKLSSRTVARISDWMQNGCNGYSAVIKNINNHDHIPPARTA